MMLATLGVQEDWGLSREGSRGRTAISWIFTLASVSAGETHTVSPHGCSAGTLGMWKEADRHSDINVKRRMSPRDEAVLTVVEECFQQAV